MTEWRSRENITPEQRPAWHRVGKGRVRAYVSYEGPGAVSFVFLTGGGNTGGHIPRHQRDRTARCKIRFWTAETPQVAGVLPRAPSREGAGGKTPEYRGKPASEQNAFFSRILLFCSLFVPYD
jgi:hypothetical protein